MTTVNVWPAISQSIPVPTPSSDPLAATGAQVELTPYIFNLLNSNRLLEYDPLGVSNSPVITYLGTYIPFNVKAYGAKGDGTTDDTDAINSAIAAAESDAAVFGGAIVEFPAGTYLVSSAITISSSNMILRGAGKGATKIVHNRTGTGHVISFAGSLTATQAGALTTLLSPSSAGPNQSDFNAGKSVTLTSATGISADDVLLIGDTYDEGMSGQGWSNRYRGEFIRVASVASNTLTLRSPLRDEYTTARTASIWKPTFLQNVGIIGLSITSDTGIQGTSRIGGIEFSVCRNVLVADVEVYGLDNAGLTLDNTVDTKVDRFDARDLTDDTANSRYGYGVVVLASEATIINQCDFRRVRHGVATGATNDRFGWCRNLLVSNCLCMESTDSAFDTHSATSDVVYTGCRADLASSYGFVIRSNRTLVSNNDVLRCKLDGVMIQLSSAVDVDVSSNRIFEPSNYGIAFSGNSTEGYPSEVTLRGNHITRPYSFGVRIEYPITDLRVMDNTIIEASQLGPTTGAAISINVTAGLTGAAFIGNLGTAVQSVITAPGGTVTSSKFIANKGHGLVGTSPAVVRGSIITSGTGNTLNGNMTDSTFEASTLTAVSGTITCLGVGGSPFEGRAITVTQTTKGQVMRMTRATLGDTSVALSVVLGETTGSAYGTNLSGDSVSRWVTRATGKMDWGDGTNTVDTTLYRSSADMLATDDDFMIATAGKGLRVKEGSNAKMGTVALVTGSAIVATTAVTTGSRILLTSQADGGTPGWLRVPTRTAGTSFVITSSSGTDTSMVAWFMVEPA